MREIRCAAVDIDHYLEEAARAKHQLDAEHWRDELRPRAMRLFTARTARLAWSRALVRLIVGELFPDELFTELVGPLDRVPRRQWPRVLAIAPDYARYRERTTRVIPLVRLVPFRADPPSPG